jgi:hypothetical protein
MQERRAAPEVTQAPAPAPHRVAIFSVVAMALLISSLAGMLALVPLYAVDRYRIGMLGSGTLLTAEGIAVIVTSSLAAMGLRRTGYRWPLYIGSACTAIGMAGLAIHPAGVSPCAWLAMTACVIGIGTGLSSPASRNAGPAARAGPVRGPGGAAIDGPDGRADRRGFGHHRDHRPVGGTRSAPGQGLRRLRRPAPRLPAGHRPRTRTPRVLVRTLGLL